MPSTCARRRQRADRLPDVRHEPAAQHAVRVGQRASPAALGLVQGKNRWSISTERVRWPSGCRIVVPAVHRAAADAFEDHDLAGSGWS